MCTGKFPDVAPDKAFTLYELALRSGVEFMDLEVQFPEPRLRYIARDKGYTKIIASHHDPKGQLAWGNNSWVPHYNKALLYGDIVKLVGVAATQDDNMALLEFKRWTQSQNKAPVIAINMGQEGQKSRVENSFLTPVSHPALPFKAAPGQLSAAEIRVALTLHGVIKPREFFLCGKPITQSKSPAMHNKAFRAAGLPHTYALLETDNISDLGSMLDSSDFGGASITIPLKLDIIRHLDTISNDAQAIGAVNTVIADPSRKSTKRSGHHLTGRNTDWRGMTKLLETAGAHSGNNQSGLVIGGGGTSRAAIYTLHEMHYSPIYVLGRSSPNIQSLIKSFPEEYNLKSLTNDSEVKDMSQLPTIAIGTIPADKPTDSGMHRILEYIFSHSKEGVLLEMAYQPAVTPLMELAKTWKTISGLKVLAAQASYQFELWTGIMPSIELLREACGLKS